MYVYKRQVTTFEGIATLLTIALVLWTVGTHMFTNTAEAANLTNVSDLLTDSEPGVGGGGSSVHTITFTTPNGMAPGETFEVTFPAGFDASSLAFGDISVTVNGSASSTSAVAAGPDTFRVEDETTLTQTWTVGDEGVASSSILVLTIGDEAGTMIVNPAVVDSYQISIGKGGSTVQDSGYTRVVIIDNVLVTAVIQTTFEFVVTGVATLDADTNGATTTIASTATTIPFGILSNGEPEILAQRLNVESNAINGYVVTAEIDTPLESSTGADIDGFADNDSDPDNPVAWTSPSNNVGDEDTWGHWGITSTDFVTGRSNEFSANAWISATSSPRIVMAHTGPADNVTSGIGSSTIGFQVEITALQEAGDDYNTTLTYIATPTF